MGQLCPDVKNTEKQDSPKEKTKDLKRINEKKR